MELSKLGSIRLENVIRTFNENLPIEKQEQFMSIISDVFNSGRDYEADINASLTVRFSEKTL